MPKHSELANHVVDQLSPLGTASVRAMFGGFGIYLDGMIMGLVVGFMVISMLMAVFSINDVDM